MMKDIFTSFEKKNIENSMKNYEAKQKWKYFY